MMMLSTGLSDEQVRSDLGMYSFYFIFINSLIEFEHNHDYLFHSKLEECPRWVIYKLKESINVKQTIEREWEEAKQDLARYNTHNLKFIYV